MLVHTSSQAANSNHFLKVIYFRQTSFASFFNNSNFDLDQQIRTEMTRVLMELTQCDYRLMSNFGNFLGVFVGILAQAAVRAPPEVALQ